MQKTGVAVDWLPYEASYLLNLRGLRSRASYLRSKPVHYIPPDIRVYAGTPFWYGKSEYHSILLNRDAQLMQIYGEPFISEVRAWKERIHPICSALATARAYLTLKVVYSDEIPVEHKHVLFEGFARELDTVGAIADVSDLIWMYIHGAYRYEEYDRGAFRAALNKASRGLEEIGNEIVEVVQHLELEWKLLHGDLIATARSKELHRIVEDENLFSTERSLYYFQEGQIHDVRDFLWVSKNRFGTFTMYRVNKKENKPRKEIQIHVPHHLSLALLNSSQNISESQYCKLALAFSSVG